ncbi:MAG: hypothetical protein IKQ60_09975 [Candidatus Methanomethylophilaceae archaeon]|nr:hypothetical protein [Candidatus Methanomethylophilaceae archaeon]
MAEEDRRGAEEPEDGPAKLDEDEFVIRDVEGDGRSSPFAGCLDLIDSPEGVRYQLESMGIVGNSYSLDSIDEAALECCRYLIGDPELEADVDTILSRAD